MRIFNLIAVPLLLCIAAPALAAPTCIEGGDDPAQCAGYDSGDKAWDECAVQAYRKAEAQCGNDLACSSRVSIEFLKGHAAIAPCGYAKTPGAIPAADMDILKELCWSDPSLNTFDQVSRFWVYLGPKFQKRAATECKRIYNSTEAVAMRKAEKSKAESRRSGSQE